jgi:deoxyribonuclease-4
VIRFGPAGIPLSCKGRTLRDGIADVHLLGLSALEIQFIKVNPTVRPAFAEEVGKSPRELPQQLVVQVESPGAKDRGARPFSLDTPIQKRDLLTTLSWSLAKEHADLATTRDIARSLDVELTLHAPYYVDFFGSPQARERSIRQVQWSAVLAAGLGARLVVTHLGFYGPGPRTDSADRITEVIGGLSKWVQQYSRGAVQLAVEPSGHPDVFGSREEVLEMTRKVKGLVPVLNLPHLAARERLKLETAAEYEPLVAEFRAACPSRLYTHFSGLEQYGPGEFRLTPIKRGSIRFDPFAEFLAGREFDLTVVSSSPLLEHDAMYMKLLYERALTRRWARKPAAPSPPARPATAPASKHPKAPPPRPQPKPSARPKAPKGRSTSAKPGIRRAASARR